MFGAELNYIMPCRKSIGTKIEVESKEADLVIKQEIAKSISHHKTVNITYDGGTSKDKMRTKKNALTVHYTDENWNIHADTLRVMECTGSQPGEVIRRQVKDQL